jgi:hypothetical protein
MQNCLKNTVYAPQNNKRNERRNMRVCERNKIKRGKMKGK